MPAKGTRKCLHCNKVFKPDARNVVRQRYCQAAGCRRASKAASQSKWLSKAQNHGYFLGPENVERMRQWRNAHPGREARRRRERRAEKKAARKSAVMPPPCQEHEKPEVLQDCCRPAESHAGGMDGDCGVARQDDSSMVLQDCLLLQDPVIVGFISHVTGVLLQEDIARMMRQMLTRGRQILKGSG